MAERPIVLKVSDMCTVEYRPADDAIPAQELFEALVSAKITHAILRKRQGLMFRRGTEMELIWQNGIPQEYRVAAMHELIRLGYEVRWAEYHKNMGGPRLDKWVDAKPFPEILEDQDNFTFFCGATLFRVPGPEMEIDEEPVVAVMAYGEPTVMVTASRYAGPPVTCCWQTDAPDPYHQLE